MEHPLEYEWTFWCTNPRVKTVKTTEMWQAKVSPIHTVKTLEEFWGVLNNLKAPSQLPARGDYFFFKKGINPAWEDPVNEKGGAWQLTIPSPMDADSVWTDLLVALVAGGFDAMEEICGTALGARKNGIRLSVWTRGTAKQPVEGIGRTLKTEVLRTKERVFFQRHFSEGAEAPLYTADS